MRKSQGQKMSAYDFVLKPTVDLSLGGDFGGATIAPPIKPASNCGGSPKGALFFCTAMITLASSSSEMFSVILSSLLMLCSVDDS